MKAGRIAVIGVLGWLLLRGLRSDPPAPAPAPAPFAGLARVFFAFDSAEVQDSQYPALEAAGGLILGSGRPVVIRGHTDTVGSDEYNQRLSEDRAFQVAFQLRGAGIPVERMTWEGAADREPIADGATEAGRAQNRRVEIWWA
jgi:outer membrane protein OmpA-like peptidoglycan-associated protein